MDKKIITWIVIIAAIIFAWQMSTSAPKESVAAIQGATCMNASDCPCWGTYNQTEFGFNIDPDDNATAYGLGVAQCKIATGAATGTCDMTWCIDVQPIGTFARENIFEWMKDNILIVAGIILLSLIYFNVLWPKH